MFGLLLGVGLISFFAKKDKFIELVQLLIAVNLVFVLINCFLIGQLNLVAIYISLFLLVLSGAEISTVSVIRGLYIAFFGYFFWVLYALGYFMLFGTLTELPFSSFLPDIFEKTLDHAETVANTVSTVFPRIAFPFATPPHLSAFGAMYFLFFLFLREAKRTNYAPTIKISNNGIRLGLFFSLTIILLSLSKTGFAILLLAMLLNFFLESIIGMPIKRALGSLSLVIIPVIIFLLILLMFPDNLAVEYITNRLFNSAKSDFDINSSGGHLSVRFMGIYHFLYLPLHEKFFGIGYLNLDEIHYHSSIITALVETGIVGLFLFMLISVYPIKKVFSIYLSKSTALDRMLARYVIVICLALLIAHFVYEMPYLIFIWSFWLLALRLSSDLMVHKSNH